MCKQIKLSLPTMSLYKLNSNFEANVLMNCNFFFSTYWLTWKVLDHLPDKITKMYFHFAYTGIILVCFHFEIEPSTIHIFNECRMQWHCVTFNNAWAKRKQWWNFCYRKLFQHLKMIDEKRSDSTQQFHGVIFACCALKFLSFQSTIVVGLSNFLHHNAI